MLDKRSDQWAYSCALICQKIDFKGFGVKIQTRHRVLSGLLPLSSHFLSFAYPYLQFESFSSYCPVGKSTPPHHSDPKSENSFWLLQKGNFDEDYRKMILQTHHHPISVFNRWIFEVSALFITFMRGRLGNFLQVISANNCGSVLIRDFLEITFCLFPEKLS